MSSLIEVDLLWLVRLVINRLHILRMHSGVAVVEHLLHCRQHRLVDVGCCWVHCFVVGAVFLNHHAIRLLDDHPRIFNRLIVGVVRDKAVVGSVGRPAGRWNGAGMDVGIDDRLIMLLVVLVIT